MKTWQQMLVFSGVELLAGVLFVAIPSLLIMPAPYKTFLGIPYGISEEYINALIQRLALMLIGMLLLGSGLGTLSHTYSVYKLEKKLAS